MPPSISLSDRAGRLFDYWTRLRNGDILPNLSSFDPLEFPDLMPNLWLAGWQHDIGDFVYRIAGDAILTTHDQPMHRRSLSDLYSPAFAKLLQERFLRLCSEPCLYHARGTIYVRIGRYGVGERLILPFMDRDATTPVVLGLTDYSFSPRPGDEPVDPNAVVRRFLSADGAVLSIERVHLPQEVE